MTEGRVTARAHANIALVKYWGKRDEERFLPANGSLSLTLDGLYTTTTVELGVEKQDRFLLNGEEMEGEALAKVSRFLDLAAQPLAKRPSARVTSVNQVPTAAGLASSASAFAALAAAGTAAMGFQLDLPALSRLARQGSGSACRSVFGGFVEWVKGELPDGEDSLGVPIAPKDHWDVRMVVAVLAKMPKAVSSREGMRRTVATSPFFAGWLASVDSDLAAAKVAISTRDLHALGAVMESSAFKMHATTMGARPPFTYLAPATWHVIESIWAWRAAGLAAYVTMDAGPNVKALCSATDADCLASMLQKLPEVVEVIICAPGPGITWLSQNENSG
jgi:diphosphomevalonate decarboxylase